MCHSAPGKANRHFKPLVLKLALGLEIGRGSLLSGSLSQCKDMQKLGPNTRSEGPKLDGSFSNLSDRVRETAYRT